MARALRGLQCAMGNMSALPAWEQHLPVADPPVFNVSKKSDCKLDDICMRVAARPKPADVGGLLTVPRMEARFRLWSLGSPTLVDCVDLPY